MSVSKKPHSSSISLPGSRPSEAQPVAPGVAATAALGAPPLPPVTDAQALDARLPGQRNTALKKGQKRPQDAEEEIWLENTDLAADVPAEAPVEDMLLAQAPSDAAVATDAGAGAASEAAGSAGASSAAGASTAAGTAATAPVAAAATLSTSGLVLGGVALAAAAAGGGGGGGGGNNPSPNGDTSPSLMGVTGKVTAGQSVAGLVVQAYDKDGKAIAGARAVTDENGSYTLSIDRQYVGQTIVLKVTDPDATDGRGYIDEATGESKDFGTALRAAVELRTTETQVAQITPLTELAARKLVNDDGTVSKSANEVTATNKAVGALFGVDDPVGGEAPNVVGKGDGDTGSTAGSNDYGKALALLSGMDKAAEDQGAASGTDAVLDRLAQAITINLTGSVSAQFNAADVDTLSLMTQAISEVSNGQNDTSLADALSDIALNVAKSAATTQEVAVFISAPNTVLGAGGTVVVSFRFDGTPSADQIAALKTQLRVQGGALSDPQQVSGNPEVYNATFSQSGSEAPKIWLEGSADAAIRFFSNDLAMQFDVTAPVLSIARIEGVDVGANGSASLLDAGDTLRVVLSASESVLVTGAPILKLNIGGVLVDATFVAGKSGTRTLVFEASVPANANDDNGVTVESLSLPSGAAIRDFASNAAVLQASDSGVAPRVDTTAPTVLSQSPLDASVVGNAGVQSLVLSFSEAVRLGSGTITLQRGADTVQTLQAGSGVVSTDGLSISFALSGATLAAGDYSVSASAGAFTDLAGNAYSGDLAAGGWNFTVGRVSLGVDRLGDGLLNKSEVMTSAGVAISGTVADPENLLAGMNKSALRVGLKPMAGGDTLWANVDTFSSQTGKWTAVLSASEATRLSDGAYTVLALIDQGAVKSSASSVVVVDQEAKLGWGAVAGDDVISTLEQGILATGKTLVLPFLAENKAEVTITLTNKADASKTLTLSKATGTGAIDSSVKLTAAQLLALGNGAIELKATVQDAAGNTNTYSKTLTVEDSTPRLQSIQLSGSAATLVPGDKVFAAVLFDKAVQLTGKAQLKLLIGNEAVLADYDGASQDGKTLNFVYTILSGQTDGNGISLPQNALQLVSGSSLKDAATRSSDAIVTSQAVADVASLKVDASAPADLAFDLTEAGLAGLGLALASGRMVTTTEESVTKVNVGDGDGDVALTPGSTASSLGAKIVRGVYGSWTVGADGSYRYALDNQRAKTQSLTAGESVVDVLTFTTSQENAAEVRASIVGSNDGAQIVGVREGVVQEDAIADQTLVGGQLTVNDVDMGEAQFQTPADLAGVYGSFSFNASNGQWQYTLDNTKAATQALRAGEQKAESLTVTSLDGTASQTITVTVLGVNDGAQISGTATGSVTEDSSTELTGTLTANDADAGQSRFQTAAPFELSGAYGDFTFNASTGEWSYVLDNGKAATQALKAGEQKTDTLTVKSLDGTASQLIDVTVTGSNDAPTAQGSIAAQTAVKGQPFGLNVSSFFADVDAGDTRSYVLSGPGAEGLSIDANGRITGTLSAARQAQSVTVTMTDGASASVTQSFDLRVVDQLAVSRIYASEVGASAGKAGDILRLVVEFTEAVTINGVPTLTLNVNGTAVTATFEQMVSADHLAYFTATLPANNNGNAISVQAIHLPSGASVVGKSSGTDLLTTAVSQSTSTYLVDNGLPVITTATLSVAENSTAVGSLAATDATALSWALAEGGQDNDLFAVSSSGVVTLKASKNFESDAHSYSVSVKATDAVGNASTQTLTVNLTDVNEAPTALALNNPLTSLAENASTSTRTKVADIAITDDALGVNTVTLEGADKDAFEVDGNVLYLKAGVGLDFETKSSYDLTVKVLDGTLTSAQALTQNFSLQITDAPDAPTDTTAPILASISSADKGLIAGPRSDTFTFKFNELVNVDTLEAAFANGKIQITSADGASTRSLGAGGRVEASYPSSVVLSGFSAAADGNYTVLWDLATSSNRDVPNFSGFSTNGVPLALNNSSPAYKHTDSEGQDWYLWRPAGWSNYVLTPVSSSIDGVAQSWWASGNGFGTGTETTPREGVLLAGEWYANSGSLSSSQSMWRPDNKLNTQPALEATGWGHTFTVALGTGHTVQQGDKITVASGSASDTSGNANASEIALQLPQDITRPTFLSATVKGMSTTWSSQGPVYQEKTTALSAGDLIRIELPTNEPLAVYHAGGAPSSLTIDVGGVTRYAYLNLGLIAGGTAYTLNGQTTSKLVFDYYVQGGDLDSAGGITVGAFNRNNTGFYDAAGNRPILPSDVQENSNTLTVVDEQAPFLWLGYVGSSTVVLQASEALDATNLPSISAFTVSVGGSAVTVQSVAVSSTSKNALVLTLATPLTADQIVQVSYTDPSSNNDAQAVQDLAGNDADSINNYSAMAIAAPSIAYTSTSFDKVELAGETELHFTVKYDDLVRISGTPRLVLQVSDGNTTSTAYADYQAYSGSSSSGQLGVEFVYRPVAGVKGQISVTALELNGGSITAYDSQGTVAANTALNNTSFFTPFTWIYPDGMLSTTGDASNNLLAPWMSAPENTPHTLSASSATGGEGNRDVLAMTVLLPDSVTSTSAAQAYSLSYNVTGEGVRQVLLKNGSTTVDTYTVPADANWPSGVEQLLYHAVYKNSAGQVQFADIGNINLTLDTHEYVDPVNANQRWVQGSLKADAINMTGRDAAQTIFIEGEQGDDNIDGHNGVDIIRGGGGNNLIKAWGGNDQVIIRRGNDTIDGGEGTDTLRFDLPGNEKKITVDADGVIHVYSASGSWDYGFVPDANGWVERYRLSTDYGTDGSNRIGVFDVALGRNVAMAKNMEQLQWRLDDNSSGRSTNNFKIGSSGDDSLSGGDVVLAGAGNDTITLDGSKLHANDWRYGNRALLIDGGSGRDVLQLDTYVSGQLSQAFEWNTGNNINASRVLKNIEGLNLTVGGSINLAAADIVNLYASDSSNLNAWGSEISGLNSAMRQFLVTGTSGSINLSDTSGWVRKTSTVTYNNQSHAVLEHASTGVQLVVDSRISAWGQGLSNEGGSTLSISSQTTNGQINEGNSGSTDVTFTVTRSGDTSGTSSATWNLVSGSINSINSTNSDDFASGQLMTGTVEFASGDSSKTIVVKVQGDTVAEANESFGVRLSNASTGTALNSAETWVTINNDDGESVGTGPAPVVTLVRADTREFVGPGSSLRFVVELDQTVTVTGTPRLSLTLTDPTGAQQSRTVYANFVPYSDSVNSTWNRQSSMEFVYEYGSADAVGAGWTYHIKSLENNNGSTIKSVESESYNVAANLTLNNVGPTSITWLYTSELDGNTGTAKSDGLFGFEALLANNTVPRSLDANSANGGGGDRDLLGIPVLLPSGVTTLAQAKSYYLRYDVSTVDGTAVARKVNLYQVGNNTPVESYSVPVDANGWPTDVEALAYYLKFKDAAGKVQETDHPNDHLVFWKSGYTATDAVNGDISRQGSYRDDTIDLSTTAIGTRTFVRGNQGNDSITGHNGTDVLFGDGGNDVVNAGAGNDFVALGAGDDTLDGGEGTDILGLWVRGQEAMPSFSADGKLQVLSAFGTWGMNNFTPDSSGFQPDWVLDFNGQTGALEARHASSTAVSTATHFEKMRIYHDQYQLVRGETTGTFEVLTGTSGNDTLNTTATQGILHGLDGDDTINAVTQGLPVMMGGNGNDTFVLGAVVFDSQNDNDLFINGGAGTDTLRLGGDIAGFNFTRPYADTQLRSIEALDLTGSTAQGAAGNTLAMTADWLQDLTDAGSTRSLTVTGDGNDHVSLLASEGWTSKTSDQNGYALYQTTDNGETLKLYIATAMASTVIA